MVRRGCSETKHIGDSLATWHEQRTHFLVFKISNALALRMGQNPITNEPSTLQPSVPFEQLATRQMSATGTRTENHWPANARHKSKHTRTRGSDR